MNQQQSIHAHLIDIVESIEADLMLPLRAHEREDRGGFHGIARQVFCYVDYLGALMVNGENSTKNAVKYMQKYFTHANSAYSDKCDLMYSMWRHGTVHEYDPKVFKSDEGRFRLGWGANNSSKSENRKWHLKCFCREGERDRYHLFINLFELVEDLKKSIRYFVRDLEFEDDYLEAARRNLEKLSRDVDLDGTDSGLFSQARSIVDATVGVIDDRGRVIREFNYADKFKKFKEEWGKKPPA